MSNPKFTPGQIIHKVGGRYGGPGRHVGETMELDDDGYRLHNVAMKVEGGYGEFVHVFPASALSEEPDTRATTPTAKSELVEALRNIREKASQGMSHGLTADATCEDILRFTDAALSNIGEE